MTQYHDDGKEPVIDATVLDALAESLRPQAPPARLRAQILERIRSNAAPYHTVREQDTWQTLTPGIDYKMLCIDPQAGTKSFLLRAAPNMRLPMHSHHGLEECLVVSGEFRMGDIHLRQGDFHSAATGTQHDEAYTQEGVTVYLRASLQDYPGIGPSA